MLLLSTVVISPAALIASAAPGDSVTVAYNYETGNYDVGGTITGADYFILVWEYLNADGVYERIDFKTVRAASEGVLSYSIARQVFLDVDEHGTYRVGATDYKANPLDYVYSNPFTLDDQLYPIVTTDLGTTDWAAINGAFGYNADEKDTLTGFADIEEGTANLLTGDIYYNRTVNDSFSANPDHYTGYYLGFKITLPEIFATVAPANTLVTVKYNAKANATTGSLVFFKEYGAEIFSDENGNACLFLKHIDSSVASIDITVDWDGAAEIYNTLNYNIDLTGVNCVPYIPSTAVISDDITADAADLLSVFNFAGNDTRLVWTPDGEGGFDFSGEIWYKHEVTGFGEDSPKGYYFAFNMAAMAGTTVSIIDNGEGAVERNYTIGDEALTVLWALEQGDILTITVDNDADAGNIYAPTVYTLDLSKVLLRPIVDYSVIFIDSDTNEWLQVAEVGVGETVTEPVVTKTGYDFVDWVWDIDGGRVAYDFDLVYGYDIYNSTTYIYATWDAYDYTIDFAANEGEGNMTQVAGEYDDIYEIPECGFTRFGYEFTGWLVGGTDLCTLDDTAIPEGEILAPGTNVYVHPTADDTAYTLTAQWEIVTYTISYVFDSAVVNDPENPVSYTVLDTVVFKAPYLDGGFEFLGWYTADGDKYEGILPGTLAEDLVLTARWLQHFYDIEIAHIYPDGYMSDNSHKTYQYDNAVYDTVLVGIEAPYGYIIDEVYFTTAAGTAGFVEYLEDIDPENPCTGAYHITMPEMDITMNVVYQCILYDVTVSHIYDGGDSDDEDYIEVLNEEQLDGSTVIFNADVKFGYAVDEVYLTGYTENGTFVTLLDDIECIDYETGTYSFKMPSEPVVINIIYKSIMYDVQVMHMYDGGARDGETEVITTTSSQAGDIVFLSVADVEDYVFDGIYVTGGEIGGFTIIYGVGDLLYDIGRGAYYFEMPYEDIIVHVVYKNARFTINPQYIFEDGAEFSSHFYVGDDTALAGDTVYFTAVAPEGYLLLEVYANYGIDGNFVEVIPVSNLAGAYYFVMPEGNVDISFVYERIWFDITENYIVGGETTDTNTIPDREVGKTIVCAPSAVEDNVIDYVEVYYYDGNDRFDVEVTEIAGAYTFIMPAAPVTIDYHFKTTLYDVIINGYIGEVLNDTNTYSDVTVGTTYVFDVVPPRGYAIDEVFATVGLSGAFVEVLPLEQVAGAYYFVMPEGDVTVTVVYKSIWFDVTIEDVYDGVVVNSKVYEDTEFGTTFVFTTLPPQGYEVGYRISDVHVVSRVDPFVEYIADVVDYGTNTYSFTMPEEDVLITVVWENIMSDVTIINVKEDGTVINTDIIKNVPEGATAIVSAIAPESLNGRYQFMEYHAVVDAAPFVEYLSDVYDLETGSFVFTMPDGDVTFTIVWKQIVFDVTTNYIKNDTEVIDTMTLTESMRSGRPYHFGVTIPEGYKVREIFVSSQIDLFAELVDFADLGGGNYSFIMPEGDVVISVYIEKIVSTVNYYAYIDGEYTLVNAEEVAYGEKATYGVENEAPDLDGGYLFTAWYNGTEQYDFDAAVVADLELVAVYDYTSYTVTFDSDGGSEIESQIVIDGGTVIEPVNPVMIGFYFDGWYLGDNLFDFSTQITADTTLVAKWDPMTFEVVLPTGEGYQAVAVNDSTSPVACFGSYSFKLDIHDEYIADGIVVKVNGRELTPVDGVYTIEYIVSNSYVSVEGILARKVFTVKFNYFDGDSPIELSNTVFYGDAATAPTDTYRYTYNFLGWFDNADGEGDAVTDFTNITADAEYFAVYERNPLADYTFGEYSITDSEYGLGFKEISIAVNKNNAEYQDREVYAVAAAQLKDGSTVLFYVPVTIVNGEASIDISLILNSNTFLYVDMYLVYGEVDLSGSLNWIDIEPNISLLG